MKQNVLFENLNYCIFIIASYSMPQINLKI